MLTRRREGDRARDVPARARLEAEARAADERQVRRARRLRIHVAAWAVGIVLLTTLWVVGQWRASGRFESFGHEGQDGQWNPTLWALGVGIWSLVVGIMALRAHLERPPTMEEIDREAARIAPPASGRDEGESAAAELRLRARRRLEGARRIRFHVAAWAFGTAIATPLWALIEWQDNGGLERFASDDQPGSWDPWILYVAGIWAGVILLIALRVHLAGRRGGRAAP